MPASSRNSSRIASPNSVGGQSSFSLGQAIPSPVGGGGSPSSASLRLLNSGMKSLSPSDFFNGSPSASNVVTGRQSISPLSLNGDHNSAHLVTDSSSSSRRSPAGRNFKRGSSPVSYGFGTNSSLTMSNKGIVHSPITTKRNRSNSPQQPIRPRAMRFRSHSSETRSPLGSGSFPPIPSHQQYGYHGGGFQSPPMMPYSYLESPYHPAMPMPPYPPMSQPYHPAGYSQPYPVPQSYAARPVRSPAPLPILRPDGLDYRKIFNVKLLDPVSKVAHSSSSERFQNKQTKILNFLIDKVVKGEAIVFSDPARRGGNLIDANQLARMRTEDQLGLQLLIRDSKHRYQLIDPKELFPNESARGFGHKRKYACQRCTVDDYVIAKIERAEESKAAHYRNKNRKANSSQGNSRQGRVSVSSDSSRNTNIQEILSNGKGSRSNSPAQRGRSSSPGR